MTSVSPVSVVTGREVIPKQLLDLQLQPIEILCSDILALIATFLNDQNGIAWWITSVKFMRNKFIDEVALKKRYTTRHIESFPALKKRWKQIRHFAGSGISLL